MQRKLMVQLSILILATLVVGCASAPSACATANACVAVAPGETIKIGVSSPFTGSSSEVGVAVIQAVQFAAKKMRTRKR